KLEETKRTFELRRALATTAPNDPDTSFYRALVEARFGQEEAAINHLREFLSTTPTDAANSAMRRKAHDEIANALMRLGRYRDDAAQWTEILASMTTDDPERSSTETGRSMCEALLDVGPPSADFAADEPLQAKSDKLTLSSLPIEINGKKAEWVLDTGANFS